MTNDSEQYTPVACAIHSLYELAIMQHSRSRLVWTDREDNSHSKTILPLDLYIRNKKEYLQVRTQENNILEIRLDKIISFSAI